MTSASTSEQWLAAFVSRAGGAAGTVHLRSGDELLLQAALNIPPPVVEKVQRVARGKGMAGLAFERAEPVQTCNLKTDDTGDVQPGAKGVNALGAIALPIADQSGEIFAVVGVAFADERELDEETVSELTRRASSVPRS